MGATPSQSLPKGVYGIGAFWPIILSSWLNYPRYPDLYELLSDDSLRSEKPLARVKWDHALGWSLIFLSDGQPKYKQRYGIPLSRVLLACWFR